MEYFWTHQYDLPPGTGYAHFGMTHFLSVLAVFVMAGVILRLGRDKMVKILPPVMLVMELSKDLYLLLIGRFDEGYLPLHLCSLGIPVFLLCAFGGKSRAFFMEIAAVLILPGAVFAIIFPDWNMYPVLNFMNLYSWVWHGLLVMYPLLLIKQGLVMPEITRIWMPLLFLACIVPPIYLFDKLFACNYLFINWPPEGTPLIRMAELFGVPGYLIGYALLALLVILIMYGIYKLYAAGRLLNRPGIWSV